MSHISNSDSLFLWTLLITLFWIGGCEKQDRPLPVVPEVVKKVDHILSKPYSKHFKDNQDNHTVAEGIAGNIERLKDHVDEQSRMHLFDLFKKAARLIKNPDKANYRSLVEGWKEVKPKLKFRKTSIGIRE
ncbi:hypothetical protein JYT87_01045 [Nitrospira defluvii]|nr:hypothetical protein [Nitrospira defluvii]